MNSDSDSEVDEFDDDVVPLQARPAGVDEDDEIKQEQMAALAELRQAQNASEQSSQSDRRLEYLMQQSEVFSHFLVDGEAKLSDGKAKTKGKGGRTRVSEETEDRNLMKIAQSKTRVVRLIEQPPSIKGGTMRSYQLEGLNWMIKLHNHGINGILADEMGLGKTLQSISIMAYLKDTRGDKAGPHIVIVPKTTVSNWMREFSRWCPSLRTVRLLGSKEERKVVCQTQLIPGKFDVLVASYESCLKEKSTIMKTHWDYLVIDEAHRIKNESSSLSKITRLFPCSHRMLVTGTPLQNNLHELWALLNFLMPDIFSEAQTFDSWFNIADEAGKENTIKKLHTLLKPFMLRRVKADVEKDLPPKKETKLYIGMTALQKEWYRRVLTKDIESINAIGGPDKVRLLNVLMQLRKVCNHPYLFEGAEEGPPFVDGPHLWQSSGKLTLLDKLLPKLRAQGSRVLIFSQMTRMLDILEDYLLSRRYSYCRIDGSTDGDARDRAMDEFNAEGSEKFCFLLSTRAGGLGINLATADTVVLYDSDWNPQVDLQAMDRAHRIGQKKEVRVFRFVTEGTVEEKIIERADRKLFLDAAVIQQGRLLDKVKGSLTKGEVMAMVKFGADEVLSSKEGTITDEDIDTLLLRGEERTAAINSKLSTEVQHSLASFSVGMEDVVELNMFTFEGENFRKNEPGRRKSSAQTLEFQIALPQRERRKNYDAAEIFGPASSSDGVVIKGVRKIPRKSAMILPDHQFFNRGRLDEIYGLEAELANERATVLAVIGKLKHDDDKAKRKILRKSVGAAAAASSSSADAEAAEPLTIEDLPKGDLLLQAESLQAEIDGGKYDLPLKIENEKAKLLAAGFPDWSKNDLKCFVTALERYGLAGDVVDAVVEEAAEGTGKSVDDVRRYHSTFFKKYKSLADWPRMFEKIHKGEKRIERLHDIAAAIDMKLYRHFGANYTRVIDDPSFLAAPTVTVDNADSDAYVPSPWAMSFGGLTKGRLFTEEEDRFLVIMMRKHGYGRAACENIRFEICRYSSFRFDWFFLSRQPNEIQKRCDLLLRAIEKENMENPLTLPPPKGKHSHIRKFGDEASAEDEEEGDAVNDEGNPIPSREHMSSSSIGLKRLPLDFDNPDKGKDKIPANKRARSIPE